jgi:hypothetical protein
MSGMKVFSYLFGDDRRNVRGLFEFLHPNCEANLFGIQYFGSEHVKDGLLMIEEEFKIINLHWIDYTCQPHESTTNVLAGKITNGKHQLIALSICSRYLDGKISSISLNLSDPSMFKNGLSSNSDD